MGDGSPLRLGGTADERLKLVHLAPERRPPGHQQRERRDDERQDRRCAAGVAGQADTRDQPRAQQQCGGDTESQDRAGERDHVQPDTPPGNRPGKLAEEGDGGDQGRGDERHGLDSGTPPWRPDEPAAAAAPPAPSRPASHRHPATRYCPRRPGSSAEADA